MECNMKTYKLRQIVSNGDSFLRGKIISIEPADDRYWILTLRYKTVSDKRVIVWFD
ncbi:hypothetical protein LCGC14_2344290 [marine sediment metagenome]|uniref:Uncharacterized protein n=1 Tax=marine sediment metagenome TaxID=412755 RepID=A0A0F9ENS0_9ZZZZ